MMATFSLIILEHDFQSSFNLSSFIYLTLSNSSQLEISFSFKS